MQAHFLKFCIRNVHGKLHVSFFSFILRKVNDKFPILEFYFWTANIRS